LLSGGGALPEQFCKPQAKRAEQTKKLDFDHVKFNGGGERKFNKSLQDQLFSKIMLISK